MKWPVERWDVQLRAHFHRDHQEKGASEMSLLLQEKSPLFPEKQGRNASDAQTVGDRKRWKRPR